MKRIVIFVLLTAVFSTPFWWLHASTGYGAFIALLMWCPGLAGATTLLVTGGKLSELAWRGADLKWIVVGWLVPLACLSAAYAAVCFLGKATFPNAQFVARIGSAMGISGDSTLAILMSHAGVSAIVGPINSCGRALGEELGWRGFLVPAACQKFGFLPGALFVGVIWALWHFPLLLGSVTIVGIVNFTVMVMGISVAFAWIRQKSDSVWPSTIMHGTHNSFRDMFLNPLTVAASGSSVWLDETGYSLAAMGACMGLCFALIHLRKTRRNSFNSGTA